MGFSLKYLFAKDRLLQIDFLLISMLPAPGRLGYARQGAQSLRRCAVARGVTGFGGCGLRLRLAPLCRGNAARRCARRPSAAARLRFLPPMPRLASQTSAASPPCCCAVLAAVLLRLFPSRLPRRLCRARCRRRLCLFAAQNGFGFCGCLCAARARSSLGFGGGAGFRGCCAPLGALRPFLAPLRSRPGPALAPAARSEEK